MILCCGEALIDMIPETTVSGRTGFVPHCGGAIFNTAIALGRLGAPVGMLTGLSDDMFGQQLARALSTSHVDTSLAITSDAPATLAFVQLSDGQAQYTFYDENTAGRMLAVDDMPSVPDDVSTLFFGGISLVSEPAAQAYRTLALREADQRVIMLDPNIRAAFITDERRYRERLWAMIRCADVLKVSDEDLDWICQSRSTLAQKAQELLDNGPSVVVVTRGSDGSEAFLADGSHVSVPAQPAHIVDTVGAGDTFNAGILALMARKSLLSKSAIAALGAEDAAALLQFAARVASITVSRAGANPPWAKELDAQ